MKIKNYKIKHPSMRFELISHLKDLSDKDLQLREWMSPTAKHRFWNTLRFSIDFIFDMVLLEEKPEDQIGYSLRNQEELEAIKPLVMALSKVIDEIGQNKPDHEYIDSPLWDEVIRLAEEAYKVFYKSSKVAGCWRDWL